jgi:hypothetical protein
MSYELQKVLAIESYKVIDLHEFAKICRYIDQTLRDVNNKFKNIRDFNSDDNADDAARDEEVIVIVISNQNNQNNDRSTSRLRFEIFKSSSRAITQSLSSKNSVNFINCYNCEKFDHFSRNCRQSRRINSNSFVREMNVHEKNDSSSQEDNLENESRKE